MEDGDMGECCVQQKKNFICGVIEGFYGRPWTTEQRKDLFRKLKKWGMDSYVYAPKDDYKHRAYWRELYTVEEADHLSSLISAAKEQDIVFYYALSPGLDMTYSNQKEIQALKRKLDQVLQFGCEAFALLFDDIESELAKADKEVFQTFGNAQVSVTNEIYTHLHNPKFLFCPTQYCSSRAVPTVQDSEYLNTLGSKLHNDIDIMWTGNKVISKIITVEAIQEITQVLRRPPVIWDNLHANDYDQKRVFLGPYSGRSPELIPHLRGVMTNPNCEFHANHVAIRTLAYWSKCSLDSKLNNSLSDNIKLETENEDGTCNEDVPSNCCLTKSVYHPRAALKTAITEWLPEFFIEKKAWGPIVKPQPQVTTVLPIVPIIPSINTCMSLTTTTTTSSSSKTTVPEVNTTQLQALAEVCSTVNSSVVTPIANPVMNSLISATKVVTNADILNPITPIAATNIELPKTIPISSVTVPIKHADSLENTLIPEEETDLVTDKTAKSAAPIESSADTKADHKNVDQTKAETAQKLTETSKDESDNQKYKEEMQEAKDSTPLSMESCNMTDELNHSPLSAGNEPMECSSSLASQVSTSQNAKPLCEDVVMSEPVLTNECNTNSLNSMQIESSEASPISNSEMKDDDKPLERTDASIENITEDDLYLLCELFYLPFEHGSKGLKLLVEFNWLKANAAVLLHDKVKTNGGAALKPEVNEWLARAERFYSLSHKVQELLKKVASCANKEICHDLFSYVWDIAGALSLLNAFVKWLSLGHFPANASSFIQGSYTWFSKGWKETFMSGDQEPWVFRGGLTADLQRLMPVDSGNDLFIYKLPEMPTTECPELRPYTPEDDKSLYSVFYNFFMHLHAPGCEASLLNENTRNFIAECIAGPFITFSSEFCIVAQNSAGDVLGFACAVLELKDFLRSIDALWIPELRGKYEALLEEPPFDTPCKQLNDYLEKLRANLNAFGEYPNDITAAYPALIMMSVSKSNILPDQALAKKLLTILFATLRANGCFGCHVRLDINSKAGQAELYEKLGFTEVCKDNFGKELYLGRRF